MFIWGGRAHLKGRGDEEQNATNERKWKQMKSWGKKKSNEMNSENIKIRESLEVGDVCLFSPFIDGK